MQGHLCKKLKRDMQRISGEDKSIKEVVTCGLQSGFIYMLLRPLMFFAGRMSSTLTEIKSVAKHNGQRELEHKAIV